MRGPCPLSVSTVSETVKETGERQLDPDTYKSLLWSGCNLSAGAFPPACAGALRPVGPPLPFRRRETKLQIGREVVPLLAVLDVPVLDLHYGGVLALVERPAIDRIFLAALLLLQDRRPMRPVFHRVQCH